MPTSNIQNSIFLNNIDDDDDDDDDDDNNNNNNNNNKITIFYGVLPLSIQ